MLGIGCERQVVKLAARELTFWRDFIESGRLNSPSPKCREGLTCTSSWPSIAHRPTARKRRIAAHKNNDRDNGKGSVATRTLRPHDNVGRPSDGGWVRHPQLG